MLDGKYIVISDEDIDLFDKQNLYIYAAFEKILKIDDGRDLVRKHHKNHDAQKVYSELQAFATTSTAASLNAADLLTYITTARLGANQTWVGSIRLLSLHIGKTK